MQRAAAKWLDVPPAMLYNMVGKKQLRWVLRDAYRVAKDNSVLEGKRHLCVICREDIAAIRVYYTLCCKIPYHKLCNPNDIICP